MAQRTSQFFVRHRWLVGLITIASVALLLRVSHLIAMRHTPLFSVLVGDGHQYDAWAQRIAAGEWGGREVFYQSPLYPYLLGAIFSLVGHHLFVVRLLQAAMGALSCVLLGVAARGFVGERAGLIAAALLACYPPAIFFDGLIQKSSLDLLLVTLALALLGGFAARADPKRLFAAGLAVGLLALNRENARVLYPVIVAWLVLAFRHVPVTARLAWAGTFTIALACVFGPVGWRNYHVGGEFLISTSQFGPNFYIGNRAGANGGYESLLPDRGDAEYERQDAARLAEQAIGRPLSAGEVSDYWWHRALADIRGAGGGWLRLLGRKLLLTINTTEAVDTESIEAYAVYSPVLRALSWLGFGAVFPIAVLGVWLTRRDWRRLGLLYAAGLALATSVAAFYVLARYRFPAVPIVLLFAAAALAAVSRLQFARADRWWPGAVLAAGAAIAANIPLSTSADSTWFSVGTELLAIGRPADALRLLERAVEEAPRHANSHYHLGGALDRTGDLARAVDEFRQAVVLAPQVGTFRGTLGNALWRAGQFEEALFQHAEAVRLSPGDAVAQNNLGTALQMLGRREEAIPHYEMALSLKPDYAEAHSNLALAYASTGKSAAAVARFRDALQLDPGNYGIHLNYGDLLVTLGQIEAGIEQFTLAVAHVPDSPEAAIDVLDRLGRAFGKVGRWQEAVGALQQARDLAKATGRTNQVAEFDRLISAWKGR